MAPPTTAEERLAEIGHRIDLLDANAQDGQPRLGIQRRVALLRKCQAAARVAVHDAAATVEESVLRLATRVNIAERSAAADTAEDVATLVAAVREELHGWDVYLERLQVKAAMAAGDGRERAEDAIRELRRYRNEFGARVGEMTATSGEGWREVREQVQATRGELESRATELEARLGEGDGYVYGRTRQP